MRQLPKSFRPTHPTGGLDGYPAIDVFGKPNEPVGSPAAGKIRRFSGKDPAKGGSPGGPYGWSMYLAADNGDDYYLTHFRTRKVNVGDRVKYGQVIGTMCDSKLSGKPNTTHIHMGLKKSTRPLPKPPERLLDVLGPKGNPIARRKRSGDVAKALPRWIKRFGSVTVRTARSPEAEK